ncbi:DUF2185 domain-containing protein [Novosphingobium sp.]|uniref:immunity protein Imm33 domain-containing protein n=1 Tax=Novosphingobium sp. TaxID=1874826 RepID=UPI0025D2CD19|nr:DUF2185 domain-containing protein [Novosphingobium sp.]
MSEAFPFHLRDADEAAAESPYTFFIPLREERVQVDVGDLVKLGFEYEWQTEEYGGERMWVRVTSRTGLSFAGILDNEPFEKGLVLGLPVKFGIEKILSILWANPNAHPLVEEEKGYWERCMVDSCVIDDGVPVQYLYREEPEPLEEGETYPDSGWRIRGQFDHASAPQLDDRKISYLALGAVLNRDDSFLALLDAEVGSAFERNFQTGEYFPVD